MIYNVKNYSVFPVLVNYIDNFLTDTQCGNIITFARNKKYKPHGALSGDAVSNHGLNDTILNDIQSNVKNCENIVNELYTILDGYLHKFGLMPVKLTNSWINFQRKGSGLLSHKHPGNSISGVIYLAVDEQSSPIVFTNPNPFIGYTSRIGITDYNAEFSSLKPSIGSCIIFPSWLSHSSGIHINESKERIALSFNADI
jgi:uncharacterized protein (TIGR02466 family)